MILILLTTLISTFLVWIPFILGLGQKMLTVFANYDGPNYLIVAKTMYHPSTIAHAFSQPLPLEYFPAHLPGYPLTVKLVDLLLPGPWSLLFVTVLTTLLAAITFYLLVARFKLSSQPIWLTTLFLFLPARWLVVRTVGSAEPLFIFATLASFYFFKNALNKKTNCLDFFVAGLFGALAQITRSPGILLFIAYFFYLVHLGFKTKKIYYQSWPLLLIPLSLIVVFAFYAHQTGDFFAYFHSGDNLHLSFPPFQIFNSEKSWLGSFWLEDIIYIYLIGSLTLVFLYKQKLYDFFSFAVTFFLATLFVAHRDLSRYSLPLAPFSLIAFAPFLERKEFKIVFAFIVIPIYLYTFNFILGNTAPVSDWQPYL
jgi:Gpi18-like mannosyltransferase